jgi:hypothetical protein
VLSYVVLVVFVGAHVHERFPVESPAIMLNNLVKVFGPIRELAAGFAITTYLVYSIPISGWF